MEWLPSCRQPNICCSAVISLGPLTFHQWAWMWTSHGAPRPGPWCVWPFQGLCAVCPMEGLVAGPPLRPRAPFGPSAGRAPFGRPRNGMSCTFRLGCHCGTLTCALSLGSPWGPPVCDPPWQAWPRCCHGDHSRKGATWNSRTGAATSHKYTSTVDHEFMIHGPESMNKGP